MEQKTNSLRAIKEMSNHGTYYTNITEKKLNPPSLSELLLASEERKREAIASMAKALCGIPVEVDETLWGGNIKIMISREMFLELKRMEVEKAGE